MRAERRQALRDRQRQTVLETLREAEAWLDGLIDLERRARFDYAALGLARIRALLAALGHPERGLGCVHVAGSKGKGSVTLAAEALLRACGLRVGAFTSPHLASWLERFRIAGTPVGEAELLAALRLIRPAVDRQRREPELAPSFFDVSTALALELFRSARVEAAVVEVGLGGRIDSTNTVESRVSLVTSIELEHTDKLGRTLGAIAGEKAGIFRPGVPALCGALPDEARAVVRARAAEIGAPLREVRARAVESDARGVRFELPDGRSVRSPVLGAHQAGNLALAIAAAETFVGRPLGGTQLAALEALELPGRIERFGDLVLDCAHTPDSVRALRETLEQVAPGRRWVLGLCVSRDKDVDAIARELAPAVRVAVATAAEPVRSLEPLALARALERAGIAAVECAEGPLAALARARALARPDEWIVLTGSVYFAGALRGALLAERGRGGCTWH
jgi:dihydrofolate synthase / folylpolyglutamate synthase